tara:strand:+ start:2093 stop:3010 length:918 start_codon:yes stop_codon:yes gene_type:complete
MTTFWNQVASDLDNLLDRKAVVENFNIGYKTTYRTVAKCSLYVEVNNETELLFVSSVIQKTGIKVALIGNGSNLLIADSGFDGLVISLGRGFEEIEIRESFIEVGAAVQLPVLARKTVSIGLAGFEWAVGVPGTIGGAVKMNAGGHGSDMDESIKSAETIDLLSGQKSLLTLNELDFGYRSSSIKPHEIVIRATLNLREGVKSVSEKKIKEIVRWRLENQPGGQNAGSVFTNPDNRSAGQLIEETGSKGLRIGTAEISEKHANFIQVDPEGNATDVYALMKEVRRRVFEEFGIELQTETKLVGFD